MAQSYDKVSAANHAENQAVEKREARLVNEAAMAEFLAKGGTIQQCAPFESGRAEGESFSSWGKPKKKPGEEPTIEPTEDDLLPG
jgi:hypothetical protein